MGPNRTTSRITRFAGDRQAGVTVIGFMILAMLFGILGLAGLKIGPLYMQKVRLTTVLDDLEEEMRGGGKTALAIRNELESRLYIESLQIPRENVSIRQVQNGFQVNVQQENRTPFVADLWFVVVIDEQVEIRR